MLNVSVILPTYNRLEQLKQVLSGFAEQDFDMTQVEVIVISDGSTDGTHEYLESIEKATFPFELIYVNQKNAGPAAARNNGIDTARGRLILFVDDDVVPAPNLISEHISSHKEHSESTVVMGPMLNPVDYTMQPWVYWEQLMLYKQYADMEAGRWEPTARQFYTGNASLERNHLLDHGGFDTSFRRAEDVELAYRLAASGMSFVFNPQAKGYHYARRKFSSWLQTPYLYGKNDVIFAREKKQHWLMPKVSAEFHERNVLIRAIIRLFLCRPFASRVLISGLKQVAAVSTAMARFWSAFATLPRFAYSGIYNLRYYQGFVDELGTRREFFEMVAKQQAAAYNLNQQESGVA